MSLTRIHLTTGTSVVVEEEADSVHARFASAVTRCGECGDGRLPFAFVQFGREPKPPSYIRLDQIAAVEPLRSRAEAGIG